MKLVRDSLVIVVLTIVALCAWQAYQVLLRVEERVVQAEQTIQNAEATLRTANRVLLSVGGTAAVLRDAAKTARDASTKQSALLEDTHRKLNAALTRFDEQVNGELLPAATRAITHADENSTVALRDLTFTLRKLEGEMDELNEETKPLLRSLTRATDGMAALANDPAIPSTLKSVDGTMKNVEKSSAHVEKALRPVRIYWGALQWAWKKVVETFQLKAGT